TTLPAALAIADAPVDRVAHRYPADGLVLRIIGRDVAGMVVTERWSRSFVWFDADEVASMRPTPEIGGRVAVRRELVARLAALGFLDKGMVSGFTQAFADDDVETATLELETVARRGNIVDVELRGRTRTRAADGQPKYGIRERFEQTPTERGVDTQILGRAAFDLDAGRFVAFAAVAAGQRVGGARVGRGVDDWGPAGIAFSLRMGDGSPPERIPPEFTHRYPWLAGAARTP
ncbi:MAG: hypothetical protein KJO43_00335, partial [Phycisphaerae bacterium]|nr:hypothetical protein [Phycisphaerae bacterium]